MGLRKFFSGGFAGLLTWFVAYPADVLKTNLQAAKNKDMGLTQMARHLYGRNGAAFFYRGVHIQLIRSFPSNSTSMLVYETVRNKLRSD